MDRIGSLSIKLIAAFTMKPTWQLPLSHQETSSSSVATTGKPEDDLMMGSAFKEFSEPYNQAHENSGQPASEKVRFSQLPSSEPSQNLLLKIC